MAVDSDGCQMKCPYTSVKCVCVEIMHVFLVTVVFVSDFGGIPEQNFRLLFCSQD